MITQDDVNKIAEHLWRSNEWLAHNGWGVHTYSYPDSDGDNYYDVYTCSLLCPDEFQELKNDPYKRESFSAGSSFLNYWVKYYAVREGGLNVLYMDIKVPNYPAEDIDKIFVLDFYKDIIHGIIFTFIEKVYEHFSRGSMDGMRISVLGYDYVNVEALSSLITNKLSGKFVGRNFTSTPIWDIPLY